METERMSVEWDLPFDREVAEQDETGAKSPPTTEERPPSRPGASSVLAEEVYQAFWHPLYLRARQRGHSHEDACDLLQDFFCTSLRLHYLDRFDSQKASLCTFVHLLFGRFLSKVERSKRAARHGGGLTWLSFDEEPNGDRLARSIAQDPRTEQSSDRPWARNVLARVLRTERRLHQSSPALVSRLASSQKDGCKQAQASVPMRSPRSSSAARRAAAYRRRRNLRTELRRQLAGELPAYDNLTEELQYLLSICAR